MSDYAINNAMPGCDGRPICEVWQKMAYRYYEQIATFYGDDARSNAEAFVEFLKGDWYVAEDIDRMCRKLDVLMNGKDGAAQQAKLCDLMGQLTEIIRGKYQ